MATKHPRLNVTLSPDQMGLIATIADKQDTSLSAIAKELIEEALELREDIYYSKLAAERDTPDAVWVDDKDVWK